MNYTTFDDLKRVLELAVQAEPLGPCCSAPTHIAEQREGFEYLSATRGDSRTIQQALLLPTTCRERSVVNTFSGREPTQFSWHGTLLGEFAGQKDGLRKGVRFLPYREMFPLAFNSATLSPPLPEAVQAAEIVATILRYHVQLGDTQAVEDLVANVSRTAFEHLCTRYRIDTHSAEILFDDNATMALYQFLGMLQREPNKKAMTFFDTGRVMPQALSGINPEFLPDNFHPAIDVWGNRSRIDGRSDNLPKWECELVEHYTERYLSDKEILEQALLILHVSRPEVIVVPTVTRAGRRLAFIEFCQQIREESAKIGYRPLIVLDDAQGLGRMTPERYFTLPDGTIVNIWNYADAVLLTGAKVTGALMGSGAVLFNRQEFTKRQLPFESHPLVYRSRQYAFVSDSLDRMKSHNRGAPGIAQTPEIASLTMALNELPKPEEVYNVMRQLRHFVVDRLKRIPGISVLEPNEGTEARFEDSIIAFYLNRYSSSVQRFREFLAAPRSLGYPAWDALPITLPAVIKADRREYLRLALDPRRAASGDEPYLLKVHYVLSAIEQIMRDHFERPPYS